MVSQELAETCGRVVHKHAGHCRRCVLRPSQIVCVAARACEFAWSGGVVSPHAGVDPTHGPRWANLMAGAVILIVGVLRIGGRVLAVLLLWSPPVVLLPEAQFSWSAFVGISLPLAVL